MVKLNKLCGKDLIKTELQIYRKIYLNQWKRVAGQCKQNVGHDNYINGPPIKISLIKVGGDFSLLRGGQVTQRSFSAPLERLWGEFVDMDFEARLGHLVFSRLFN